MTDLLWHVCVLFFFYRSTADLESYHNHLLMYTSQHSSFSPPVWCQKTAGSTQMEPTFQVCPTHMFALTHWPNTVSFKLIFPELLTFSPLASFSKPIGEEGPRRVTLDLLLQYDWEVGKDVGCKNIFVNSYKKGTSKCICNVIHCFSHFQTLHLYFPTGLYIWVSSLVSLPKIKWNYLVFSEITTQCQIQVSYSNN
jgi:hypothetical protein